MGYWIYLLLVGNRAHGYNRRIYTGYTHHLISRIIQHCGLSNTKGARMTRKQPIELVYLEYFPSRKQAMKREWQLKKESPYNQKKYKLELIAEFQKKYGQFLQGPNEKLIEYFDFLNSLVQTISKLEKVFIKAFKEDSQKNTP